MADNSSSPAASAQIPWRKRADLQATLLQFEGRPAWGIKDPVTLAYYELSDEAYFVFDHLNGQTTMSGLCQSFHQRYRPRTLSEEELRGFLGQLLSQNLVLSELPGHGPRLVAKSRALQSRRRWMKLTSLLAIRFRGFDPDRLLTWMLSWLGWLFTPWAVCAGLLVILSAILLVVVQFDELLAKLPSAQALLTVPNLLGLGVALAVVKVLHELGHGLTCKRFGGECHELGVMLLVFTPTLYCNVSDIWMLKSKWQRIAVSAAGMWVEAVIAAISTLLWWFSEPGLFHSLCLNVMFLCGVSTFFLNGNPLLRYDGYFVLADWCEIPNLQQQSMSAIRGQLSRWFCGFDLDSESRLTRRRHWGLLSFGVASSVYRVMVTSLMLWGLYHWLKPIGLGVVAQLLAVPTLGLMLFIPLALAVSFVRSPVNRNRIRWPRFWLSMGITLAGIALLVTYPLPSRVKVTAIVDDDEAQRVYVTMAGTLTTSVKEGQQVVQGDEIARLEEPDLGLKLAQLEGELKLHQLRLANLERQRVSDPQVAQSIPTLREAVQTLEQQLSQRQQDAERLILRAPQSGIVMAGPPQETGRTTEMLASWTGSPLAERNRGCYLKAGTTYCLVGSPDSHSAIVIINQDNINLVRPGQAVRIMFNEFPGEVYVGQIEELAAPRLDTLTHDPRILRDLPTRPTPLGAKPVGTWYQARIRLSEPRDTVLRGSSGIASIEVDRQSLATRFVRWLKQTFGV
jgi:putative peptide zinc metalloprotease protein